MPQALKLEFDRSPPLFGAYLRALMGGNAGLAKGQSIPRLEAVQRAVTVEADNLRAYCKVCEFTPGNHLPVTFPHIMASPLHMALLSHKQFPLRMMGLVHVRNVINQHRAINADEKLDINVWLEGHREVHNGLEFDLVTEVSDAFGERLWDSVSTMLSRGKSSSKDKKPRVKPAHEPQPELAQENAWHVPADIGRRYGKVSGDVNPIHMHPLSAKLFGFPRAIAHGMWSLAHAAADLQADMPDAPFSLQVAFKKPVLLPASAVLCFGSTDAGLQYRLQSKDGRQLHLSGSVRRL